MKDLNSKFRFEMTYQIQTGQTRIYRTNVQAYI